MGDAVDDVMTYLDEHKTVGWILMLTLGLPLMVFVLAVAGVVWAIRSVYTWN